MRTNGWMGGWMNMTKLTVTFCSFANMPTNQHACDDYETVCMCSRRAMMSLGSSQPWGTALQMLTGSSDYDVTPLLQYYQPIYRWLQDQVQQHNIPVGWD